MVSVFQMTSILLPSHVLLEEFYSGDTLTMENFPINRSILMGDLSSNFNFSSGPSLEVVLQGD